MRFYFTTERSVLFSITLLLISMIFILSEFFSSAIYYQSGKTNSDRVEFISSLGYEVCEESLSVKEIIIPQKFSNVYENYNTLQKRAGFDLNKHKGETANVYTYRIKNSEDLYADIIVSGGKIIGGDICSHSLNGEIYPLRVK